MVPSLLLSSRYDAPASFTTRATRMSGPRSDTHSAIGAAVNSASASRTVCSSRASPAKCFQQSSRSGFSGMFAAARRS